MCISFGPRSNHLLAALSDATRQRLLPLLERVEIPQGLALHESGSQMNYAYFPTTAVVSLICGTADGASMEYAVVGNEGIVGAELLLGDGSTPSRAVAQTAGAALRLSRRTIQDEFARGGSARYVLLRYTQALMTQVAQTAVCARHHSLDQRLCRWLLMRLDRVQGDEISATQEQVANLLGVRRESATEGALRLQALGLIRYARGRILALDRKGLAQQACECYAVVKKEYDRLLPGAAATPQPRPTQQTRHAPVRRLASPTWSATPTAMLAAEASAA
jgi:CRP-like cAMP-binding protein